MKIVIVGHGPSLKGAKKGDVIDQFEKVVRLKYGEQLLKFPEDYGKKTDALCASTEIPQAFAGLECDEYWGYPKLGWFHPPRLEELPKRVRERLYIPLNVVNYWNYVFRCLDAKHPNVSTGTGAIIIACWRWNPKEIFLGGFDTVLDPRKRFSRNNKVSRSGVGPYPSHDWPKENHLIKELEKYYECQIKPL